MLALRASPPATTGLLLAGLETVACSESGRWLCCETATSEWRRCEHSAGRSDQVPARLSDRLLRGHRFGGEAGVSGAGRQHVACGSELCMTTLGVSRAPRLRFGLSVLGFLPDHWAQGRRLLGALLATCWSNGSAPRPIRRRPAAPAPQGGSTYSRARFRIRKSLVWAAGNLGERVSSDAHAVLSEAFELLLGARDERVEIEPREPRVVGERAAERLPQ